MKKFCRNFLVLAALLTYMLPAGDALASSEKEKAVELFKSGQYQKAYDLFSQVFIMSPENPEVNFYMGRAAFETGNYEMAIMAFERILIVKPDEPRVKLEMARAFQKLGANDTARQYCHEVLKSNPPERVKENIKNFLAYIDKTEQKNFLSGTLSAGVDWNNNVWASPTSGRIKTLIGDISLTGPSARKTQDWVYNTTLDLNHTFRQPDTKDAWKTQAIVYNGIYEKTSALDLRLIGFVSGYQRQISSDKSLNISLLAGRVELGSEKYLSTKGAKVSLESNLRPGLLLKSTLKYEIKAYPEISGKDAKNTAALLDMIYYKDNIWYNALLRLETENAKEDQYDYGRVASAFSLSYDLPFEMTGSFRSDYQFTAYKSEDALFGKKRRDHQFTAGCLLKRKVWQLENKNRYIALNFNFQHTWTFSTIDLYDYRMGLAQLFLTYNF